jgi:uncharacterized repeat protein (TIGR03803 family)
MIGYPADTFKSLVSFNLTDGLSPNAPLVQGLDGNFYGTTFQGGDTNAGTFFKITPTGILTTLHTFGSHPGCTGACNPLAGLLLATNGNFYGTTVYGGASFDGTVFEITPAGKLTTLYSFCSQPDCIDGSEPIAVFTCLCGVQVLCSGA